MDANQKNEDTITAKDVVLVTAVTFAVSYAAVKVMGRIADAAIDTFTLAKSHKKTKK